MNTRNTPQDEEYPDVLLPGAEEWIFGRELAEREGRGAEEPTRETCDSGGEDDARVEGAQ